MEKPKMETCIGESLKDLLKQASEEGAVQKRAECLASALGITPIAVTRWLPRSNGRSPVRNLCGMMLLKVCYFLSWKGYDVPFVSTATDPFVGLGALVTLGIVSPKEIARPCRVNANEACDLILLSSPKHTNLFAKILGERFNKEVVEERKRKFLEGSLNGAPAIKPAMVEKGGGVKSVVWKEGVLSSFMQQLEAMKPLGELLLSDEFSAEERRKLRLVAKSMYELSDLFNALLSEQGRAALLVSRNKRSSERVNNEHI